MAELDISGNSIQLDCSVDSGICVEGVTKDLKKKIQEFKRILFILERDKEAMRLLRERLSRIAERNINKKKKDGQSVCNVCFTQIDTDDSKTCVACYSCAKNVCRGEKCSEWVPHDGEWRCQLCAAQRDSYGKASTWVQEQQAVKRASLTECSYPMRARSEIYIPLCDPNESAFLCNFESVSEVASPINPNQKQHIREYIEEVLAEMIGGSLGNSTVEQISTNKDYIRLFDKFHENLSRHFIVLEHFLYRSFEDQQVRSGHELQGVSNVRLRRLIESIIAETIRQPPFASAGLITTTSAIDSSDIDHGGESLPLNGNANHCNGNGGQYFESKQYHDLLATAVLNKIVNTHGNGRLSESSPDLTSSSVLDSNHNAINLNKTDESVSSSSSVEPRSESSLTDPIRSINKDEDGNFGNFYHDDVANDNIEADRESVLSDFISSHMVPLPHISAEPASEEDEDEEDYISVASSRDANWEDNWLFKKKKSNKTSSSSVGMLVPAPKEDIRALIGDKPTDEVSDLSEIGSDTDDSSLEMISASLEPLNDRLVNKHLIGGKNTKIVLDELVDRTSMISTSSLPDNEPPYTETKNEFVVSNDGLNESQSLKISVNNCNKAISNEAINSNVTKAIPAKVEKLTKEGQVTEDESIVPPPNDFTDDEKMRNLLAKFNEEQHNKTDSGDENSSSMSPRSSISCALSESFVFSAGIERAELDAYEGITDFSVEDEEGPASEIDPEMAENSSRRPSVIEILAAIALGPMLAVSASDDRNILTELELSSLMELNELAMAQMSAKTNEERRLGVIAEESFDTGPGDDHKIESIECNEEADLLSSPKMVMDAIRELVGKDLMRSVQSEESSIQIEEITDDSINTEEIGQQNILNEPAESVKNSEEQTSQAQLEIEETFEILPVEQELKEGMVHCQTETEEDMQQGQSDAKMADSELEQSHMYVIKSNDDENGITINSLSEDFGFEKVIPDDTSSISDESLHTIGSSSEYSDDGDTTSFFIDEHKISVTAEMSTDQKLQEKIAENQSSESDKTVNEFILPPPTAFCDKESKKHDEDDGGSEKDQVIEAHINSETIQDIILITSENSNNEIEKTVTEEETHNEKPCTEIELNENTQSVPKIEIVEISTSETNKSDEPPDKEALDDTLPKTEAELVSSIETVQSESTLDSEIKDETKCNQNLVKISQEKVVPNIDELTEEILEEKSQQIIVEQTASTVTNEPAALKTLSEAQLALLELNSKILNVEEPIVPINSQQITEKTFNDSQELEEIKNVSTPEEFPHKVQSNEQHVNDEANEISEEITSIQADGISEVQSIEESPNEQKIILKDEIIDTVSESLNNNSASEIIDLVELKHQETSKKQSEENIFEVTIQVNATETTTTEDIRVLVDDTSKTEIKENPEAEDLSSEAKSSEPTENLKSEETDPKIIEEKGNDVIVEEIVPLIETSPDSQNIGELLTNSSIQPSDEKASKSEDVIVDTITEPIKGAQIDDINAKLLNEVSADAVPIANVESTPKIEDSLIKDNWIPEKNKQDTEEDEQSQKKIISQEQESLNAEIVNSLDSGTKLPETNIGESILSDRKEDSEKPSSETIENEKKPADEETSPQTESSNSEEPQTVDIASVESVVQIKSINETKDQNEGEQASILVPTDGGNINKIESFPNDSLNDATNLEENLESHIQTIDAVVNEGSQSEITLTVQASFEPSNEEPSETNAIQDLESHKAEDVNNISQNESAQNVNGQQSELSKKLSNEDLSDIGVVEKEDKEISEIENLQVKLHVDEAEKSPVTLLESMNVDESNLDKDEQKCEESLLPIQQKEVLNQGLSDVTNKNLEGQQSQNIQTTDNKTDDDKQVEIEKPNLTEDENITENVTSKEENPDNQIQEKSAVEAGTTDLLSTPSNEEVKKAEKVENITDENLQVSTNSITKESDSITGDANDENANVLKKEHPIEISEKLKHEEEQMQQTETDGVKKPLDDLESPEKIEALSTVNVSDPESMNTGIVQGETEEKEETSGELKDKLVKEIKESLCNDTQIKSVDVEQLEKDAEEVVNDFNSNTLEALPSNDEQNLTEPNAAKSMLDNADVSTEPNKMESVADTASTEEQCVSSSTEEKVHNIESSETNTEQIQMKVVTEDSKTEISTPKTACEDPTIEPADLKSDTVSSVENNVRDLKIEGPMTMPKCTNDETDATSASESKFEVKIEKPEENALTGENKESSPADVVAKEPKVEHIQIEVVSTDSKTEVSTQTNACEDPTIEPADPKSDTVSNVENSVADRKIEKPVTMPKDYNKEIDETAASSSEVEVKVEISEENALTSENKETSTADVVTNKTKVHIQKVDIDSNQQTSELENLQINSKAQSKIKNSESTEITTDQKTYEKSTCTDPETVEPEIEIPEIKKSQIKEADKEENTSKPNDQTLILEDSSCTEISSDEKECQETDQINTELEQAKETLRTEESNCNTGTFISEETISTEDISEKKKNHTVRQNAIEEQPENNSIDSKVEDNIQILTSEEPIAAKDLSEEQGSEESKQVATESDEDVDKNAEYQEEGTFIPVVEPKEELPENKSDETVSTNEISEKDELTKVEGIIEVIDKLNQESGQICQEPGLDKDLQVQEEIPNKDEKVVGEDKSGETQKSEETEGKVIALDAPVEESTSLSSPIDSEDTSSLKIEIEKQVKLVSESTTSAEKMEEVLNENENINKIVLVEENADKLICEVAHEIQLEEICVVADTSEQLTLGQDTGDIKDAVIPIPEVQISNKEVKVETQNYVVDVDDLTLSTDDEKIRSILSESELTLKTDDEKIEDILVVKSKSTNEATGDQTAVEEISLSTQGSVPENKDLSIPLERVDDARETATILLDAIQKEVNSEIETTLSSETEPQTAIENNEEKVVQNGVDAEKIVKSETEPNIISGSEMIACSETVEIIEDKEVPKEIISEAETIITNETESEVKVENVEDNTVQDEIRPDTESILSGEIRDKAVEFESSNAETLSSNDTETEVTTENVEDKTTQNEVRPETESQTNIEKVGDQDVQNEGSPDASTTVSNEIESGVSIQTVEDKEVPKEIISEAETIISNEIESEIKVETRDKEVQSEISNAETLSPNNTETEVTKENVEDKTTQNEVSPETESQTNIEKVGDQDVQNEGSPDASTTVSNEIESGVSIQTVEDKEVPKEIISEAETIISNEIESEIKVETRDKEVQSAISNAETLLSINTETEATTENVEDKANKDEIQPETESQTNIEKVEDQVVQNEGSPDASTTVSNEIESGVSIQIVEDKEVPKEIITDTERKISNETESEVTEENVEDEVSLNRETTLSSETGDKAVQKESSNAETVSSNDAKAEVTEENVEDKSIKDEVQPETESEINIEKVEDRVFQNEGSPDASTTVSNEIESGVGIKIVEDKGVPKEIIRETETKISNETESEVTEENVEDEVSLDRETTLSSETGDKAVQKESSNAETVSSNDAEAEVTEENVEDKSIKDEVQPETESEINIEKVEDRVFQNEGSPDASTTVSNEIESGVGIKIVEDKEVPKEIIIDSETKISKETESEVTEENVEDEVRLDTETTLSSETGDKAVQQESSKGETVPSNNTESEVTIENIDDKPIQGEVLSNTEIESQPYSENVEDQAVQKEDTFATKANESDVNIKQFEDKVVLKEIISEPESIIPNETESEVTEENVEGKAVQDDVTPNAEITLSSKTEDGAPKIANPTAEAALSNDKESEVATENVDDKTIQDKIPSETEFQTHMEKVEVQAVQNENSHDARMTVTNENKSDVSNEQVEVKVVPMEITSEPETTISNETVSKVTSNENVEDKVVQDDVRPDTETTLSSKTNDKALPNEVTTEKVEDRAIQDEARSATEPQIYSIKVEDQAIENENSPDARTTVSNESVNIEQVEDKIVPKEIITNQETTISNKTESGETLEKNIEDKAVQDDDVRINTETTFSGTTEDKALQNKGPSAETTLPNDTESELNTDNVKDKAIQDEVPPETESQIPTKEGKDQVTQNENILDARTMLPKERESDVGIEEVGEKVIPKEIVSNPETVISNATESEVTSKENNKNNNVQDEVQPETETILLSKTESQITPEHAEDTTVQDEVHPDAATTLINKVPTEHVEDKALQAEVLPDSKTTLLSETISQIPTETDVEMTDSNETESLIVAENVEDKTEFEVTTENVKDEIVAKEIISDPENIISLETAPEVSIEIVEIKAERDELIPDVRTTVTNETESQISTENVEDKTVQSQVSLDVETAVLSEIESEVITKNVEDKTENEATVENGENKTVENEIRTDAQTTLSSPIESQISTVNVEDKAVPEDIPHVETVLSNKIEPKNTAVFEEIISELETKISNETVPEIPPENVETKIDSNQALLDFETTIPSENETEVTTEIVEEEKVQKEIISEPETIKSNETVPIIPIENVDDKTILNEESPGAETTLSSETESKILTENIQDTKVSNELNPDGETTVLNETVLRIETDNVEVKIIQNEVSLETETIMLNTPESNMPTDKIENIIVQEEVSLEAEKIIPNESESQKPAAIQEESSNIEKISEIVQSDTTLEALESKPEFSKDDLELKDSSVSIEEKKDCLENAEVPLSEKDAEVSQTNSSKNLEETQSEICIENPTENIDTQYFEKEAESKDIKEQDSEADNLKADINPKEQIDTTATNQVTNEFQSLDVKNSKDTTTLDEEFPTTKEPEIPGAKISTTEITEITVIEETNEMSSVDHRNDSTDPKTQGEIKLDLGNIISTENETDKSSLKEAEIEESDVKNYEKIETEELSTASEKQVSDKASSEDIKEDSTFLDTTTAAAANADNREKLAANVSKSQEIQAETIEFQNEPVQSNATVSENKENKEPLQGASLSTSEEISAEKKLHTKEDQENEPIIEETSKITEASDTGKLTAPTKIIEETKDLTLRSQELNIDSKLDSVPEGYDISETNSEDSFESAVEDVEIISDLKKSTSISEITSKASETVTLEELTEVCGMPNEIANIEPSLMIKNKTEVSLSQNEPNKESNISVIEATLDDTATELTALPESTDLQKSDFIVTDAIALTESKDIEKTSSIEETNITEVEGNQVKGEEIQNQETSLSEIELVSDGTEELISKQTDNLVGDVENSTEHSNFKLDLKDLTKVSGEKSEPKAQEVPEAAEPETQEVPETVVAVETIDQLKLQNDLSEPENQVHIDSIQVEESPTQIALLDSSVLLESEISIKEETNDKVELKKREESVPKEEFSKSDEQIAEEVSLPISNLSTELTITQDFTANSNDKHSSIVEEVSNKSTTQRSIAENSEVVILEISDGKNKEEGNVSKEEFSVSQEKTAEEGSGPIPNLLTEVTITQDAPVNTIGKPSEKALIAENSGVDILEISDGTTNTIKDTNIAEETIVVSTSQESVLDSKKGFEVREEIISKGIIIDESSKSLETTNDIENQTVMDTQNKPLEGEIVAETISETEILQGESNKVSAKADNIENTVPINKSDEAQTSVEGISITEIPQPIKSDAPNENIQIQKTFDTSEEQSLKSISGDIATEDKLSETMTEQVAEVVEIPPIEVLTATCKIITHPPLQKTESLIESAQCLYEEISHQVLETSPEINTPTLAEELRMAADINDTKESSKSERVIPQSIACESRCFTPEPQPEESIASDSVVATEQPNAQDAAQGNHISQVAKQLIFAEQSAKKSKAKHSGSSKFRNLTLRDRRFLAELEKRRKQRELIQNYLDSLDCTDTQSYLNEDLYLFESKCSIERSPYSLFIEPSDYCIVGATSPSPIANTHFLNTNILFSDRISSESNCTDDSTTTVIDTFGSMESRSNSDSSGEEFSPDDSTDRDSSATATTANNSILTTTNKATNQSHIYSPPPPPLPLQPQPELRTESACSKLLQTRTSTGGNEEHVDDDPLKHLVPGSIAEREYKKWYNAVDMPNNPYSVEALRRRLSGGLDRTLDLPNISPCNEDNPLQLSESPAPEAETKGQERDYSRYSRDYYINDAKQASGTTKKSPTSPPQVSSPTSTASSIEVIRNGFENRNSKDWTLSTPVRRSTSLKYPKQFRSSVIPKTHNDNTNNDDNYDDDGDGDDDDTMSQYSSRSLRIKSKQRISPSPSVLTHFEKQLLHKDLKRNSFRAISSTTKDFVLNPIFDQNEFFKDTKLSIPKDSNNLSDGDTADSGVDSCLNGVAGDGTRTNLVLDERVKHNSQTVETTPVKEMCHKLEKQCRIEADIYLATPVQVIEDIDVPQAFADKKPIQTVGRTITTSLTTEAVSRLSSDTSSILTNESLTPSEDSDTIRIYDLKKQETRLVKETTQTTTITVPKSPEKKVRPTELDIMPTLAPPIATVSAKCSTPTSFKFLQPKRKLINPSQVLSIDQDSTPLTPSTPEKTVIEAEVVHAMPSVKALAKAFLMTSSTSSSDNKWRKVSVLNRLQGPEAGISNSFVKARAKTPMQFFKPTTPTATSAAAGTSTIAASFNRGIQKQPEPVIPDTTSQGSEDATIASDLSSLETDPPSRIDGDTLDEDRVVLSGCLRNNIAFFENLKNK
ncbi:titin [Eupeodes corollae]|uniref:titin n=1 Tax=Eupeodes corollae TaxID=290404 RepID=UPI00249288C6|nr:titin [Eupeodes corollae]